MTWTIDTTHSDVGFAVRHMMISTVRGKFGEFTATVELDPSNLGSAKVEASIKAASVDTHEAQRDAHLRSPDFFDVENHPNLTFKSTKTVRSGDDVELHGDLTIRGITRPVVLKGEMHGPSKDPWGMTRVGFSLTGEVEREEFGLTWNQALEAGGVLVAKKVKLVLELQVVDK